MKNYGEYIDRMAWNIICAKIVEKARFQTNYSIVMQPRSCGKTITTKALYKSIMCKFVPYFKQISIKWCNGFEVVHKGKRQYCHIYIIHDKVGEYK